MIIHAPSDSQCWKPYHRCNCLRLPRFYLYHRPQLKHTRHKRWFPSDFGISDSNGDLALVWQFEFRKRQTVLTGLSSHHIVLFVIYRSFGLPQVSVAQTVSGQGGFKESTSAKDASLRCLCTAWQVVSMTSLRD